MFDDSCSFRLWVNSPLLVSLNVVTMVHEWLLVSTRVANNLTLSGGSFLHYIYCEQVGNKVFDPEPLRNGFWGFVNLNVPIQN